MKLEVPPHLEHLIGLRHLFRRLNLHFIVWSGSRNRYIEELMVFQACDRGARISMEKIRWARDLLCFFVRHRY